MKHAHRRPLALAVDIGNGYTKFSCSGIDNDGGLLSRAFPSYVTLANSKESMSSTGEDGLTGLDVVLVNIDGQNFRVGPDSLATVAGRDKRLQTEHFYNSPQYRALFTGALAYMDLPTDIDTIDVIGFGLPLTVYSDKKLRDEIRSKLTGNHLVPRFKSKGHREIDVQKIVILPQLAGSLIALSAEEDLVEEVGNGTNLVIDVGYGTLLWLVSNGLKPQVARSSGNWGGVASLLNACARNIDRNYEFNPTVMNRIDEAIRLKRPARINGQSVSLEPYMSIIEHEVKNNLNELAQSVGQFADIDNIFLVGGGAHLYHDALKQMLGQREIIMTSKNAQMSNLMGFQIYAESALQEIA